MKLKPGLPWRTEDIREARALGYLLRSTSDREWNHPRRKKCVAVHKAEGSWTSEELFDIRHGDAEFGVGLASFQSCFATILPSLCFGMIMYILCYYIWEVCGLLFDFDFYR